MQVEMYEKRYFRCQSCGDGEFQVTNLWEYSFKNNNHESGKAGPWHCDRCGQGWHITYYRDGRLEIEKADIIKRVAVVLSQKIQIRDHQEPIYLIVSGIGYEKDTLQESHDHHQYHYESGTCPVNYFRSVIGIIVGDGKEYRADTDPHGIFNYEGFVDIGATTDDQLNNWFDEELNHKESALECVFDKMNKYKNESDSYAVEY